MKVGNLTRWKSVSCSTCGAEPGGFCYSGSGRSKHEVTTYVHSARQLKYSLGAESTKEKDPVRLNPAVVFDDGLAGVFVTASEILKNPSITKISFTVSDGRTIQAEQLGSDTLIKISQ